MAPPGGGEPMQRHVGLYLYTETDHSFWQSIAVSALMALKHCQERNPAVLDALGPAALGNVELNVTFSTHNTKGQAAVAVREFLRRSETTDIVVGAAFSSVSIPLSTVASVQGRPSVSYASTSPELSHRLEGSSLFTRPVPSDTETAQVLCTLLQSLKVANVALLFVDDGYGLGYRDSMSESCGKRNIAVHPTSFDADSPASISFALDFVQQRRLNIMVVAGFDDAVGTILDRGTEMGLTGPGKLLIFSDGVTNDRLKAYLRDRRGSLAARQAIEHAFRVQPSGGFNGANLQRFLHAYEFDWPDHIDYLNKHIPELARPGNAILNRTFFRDSVAIAREFAPFAYDAGAVACRALAAEARTVAQGINANSGGRATQADDGEPPMPKTRDPTVAGGSDGRAMYDFIVNDSFEGVSGTVRVDPETGTRELSTAIFSLQGFTTSEVPGDIPSVQVRKVGFWVDAEWRIGLALGAEADLPDVPPSVDFSTERNFVSTGLKIASMALSSVLILVCVALIVYTWKKRFTRIFSRAQPTILIIFLVGLILSTFSTFFIGVDDLDPDLFPPQFLDFSCMAFFWLWSLGNAVTFSALVVKLYRIWRIFSNRALRRIKITNNDLYRTIVVICSIDLIILTAWSAVSPMTFTTVVLRSDIYGNTVESYGDCASENTAPFLAAVVAYNVALFVAGVIFSYKVRKADSDYQESQWITISLVSQCQMFMLGVPLIFVFGAENTEARFLVTFFVVWLNNVLMVAVLFGPKVRAVAKNLKHAASANSFTTHVGPPRRGPDRAGDVDPGARNTPAINAELDSILCEQPSDSPKRLSIGSATSVLDLFSLRRSASSRIVVTVRDASTQWTASDASRAAACGGGGEGPADNAVNQGCLSCAKPLPPSSSRRVAFAVDDQEPDPQPRTQPRKQSLQAIPLVDNFVDTDDASSASGADSVSTSPVNVDLVPQKPLLASSAHSVSFKSLTTNDRAVGGHSSARAGEERDSNCSQATATAPAGGRVSPGSVEDADGALTLQ